jgi:phosphopantothenoylcysteine decarboxylase/phosphopantothenate--cysteine ligase
VGKRRKSAEPWSVELVPAPDVAAALGARKPAGQLLVLFGADVGPEGLERKRKMLADKHADLVVYNDIARPDIAFEAPDNEVVLVAADGERRVDKAPKPAVAAAVLDEVERLLARVEAAR